MTCGAIVSPPRLRAALRISRSPCAAAADLTIGIGADVTAIDPHFHNVTPNNNVAAHIFDYLVLRDERQKPIPGLAESWKTVDPLTWEFKLRKGVKFHDGSDFTAADVVASIERVPQVPNSPSPFTAYTKQIKEMIVVDPYTIRFKTASPYPLMPYRHDAGRDHFASRPPRLRPRISTAARRRSAPARTSSCITPRATASSLRATTRTGAARRPGKR